MCCEVKALKVSAKCIKIITKVATRTRFGQPNGQQKCSQVEDFCISGCFMPFCRFQIFWHTPTDTCQLKCCKPRRNAIKHSHFDPKVAALSGRNSQVRSNSRDNKPIINLIEKTTNPASPGKSPFCSCLKAVNAGKSWAP